MHPLDNTFRVWLPLGAAAVLTTALVVGVLTQPDRYALGFAPDQPIPFSHKVHAGDNRVPCQYCHTGTEVSRHAGVPALSKCMNCHRVTKVDSDQIKLVTAAFEAGRTIEWKRVYSLPDHVYFDHRPHVRTGIACQECHGQVEKMEVVERVMNMRMGKCLQCHRGERVYLYSPIPVQEGPTNCWACHR